MIFCCMKVEVGKVYELDLRGKKAVFGVMYAFEKGKNRDVYSLMVYRKNFCFEFPVKKEVLDKWLKENRLREITAEEVLNYILGSESLTEKC